MTEYKFPAQAPQEAIDWFQSKQLKPSFDYRDVYREEHAYAFVVAKVMQMDVLQTIRDEFLESLKNGGTVREFEKALTPKLQKLGWWGEEEKLDPITKEKRTVQLGSPRRLKTIYRVNMRSARAAGQWQRIERTRTTHPYLLYELGPSREHREQHVGWAGILLPSNDPWWQTHYPPNGWGCKCRVRQVSKREYERLKGSGQYLTQAPVIKRKEWINKRSGEVLQVPEGIDPSFDMNVGMARQEHLQQLIKTKLNSSHPSIAAAGAKALVNSPAFTFFLEKPANSYPIASLDEDLKRSLNVKQNAVQLSAETLAKQRKNYPNLSDDEYRLLPDLVTQAAVIQQGGELVLFFHNKDRFYKAILKTDESSKATHVESLSRAKEQDFNAEVAKGKLLRPEQGL